jgi:hypothetical protein
MRNGCRIEPAPAAEPGQSAERKPGARAAEGRPYSCAVVAAAPESVAVSGYSDAVLHRHEAPGMLVETIRRKADSAGGDRLFEYSPYTTARCGCGIREHRDLFSAYLGLHVRRGADGLDRLDLEAANTGWLHRQDIDGCRGPATASSNRRGRRHPPTRRSVARINVRRKARAARRQSRSARTSTTNRPTALPT